MIYDPVTIKCGSTVREALSMMSEYHIGGIPVVDDKNLLVGIVTNRDLRFERDLERLVDEVMTKDNLVTVSYTHLRAHETGRNLVCRLLLEKKKKKIWKE